MTAPALRTASLHGSSRFSDPVQIVFAAWPAL
jgi:hypothetical protein